MIEQGTDGFSCGDLENGVAMGASPHAVIFPIECGPFQLIKRTRALDPEGWFGMGHCQGQSIWNAPPAAVASSALEQLCEANLAQPYSAHIFVVPVVMTPMWQKRLGRAADFVFTLHASLNMWPTKCHEPLTIALVFPFLLSKPWQIHHCPDIQQ